MNDVQNILNKIALLKNLKERAGTPAEAAEAARRIQALMTKHSLTEFQVIHATRSDERTSGVVRDRIYAPYTSWRFHLLSVISRANYVEPLHYSGTDTFTLIGHPHNIEMVKLLFDYLDPEIMRLADIGWKNHEPEERWSYDRYGRVGFKKEGARSWKNNFRYGAASEVGRRLTEERDKVVNEYEGGSALVLVQQEEVNAAIKEWYPKMTNKRIGYNNGSGGFHEGREAGRGINLARQIGG